jgi:MtN3 and saliva related transmembrane protein
LGPASLSYLPQVKKAWPRDSTEDLSWKMLSALTSGLALWIIDGLVKVDRLIVAANGVGGKLSGVVLVCKIRDMTGDYRHSAAQVCPTAGRLGKASEKNCRLSIR